MAKTKGIPDVMEDAIIEKVVTPERQELLTKIGTAVGLLTTKIANLNGIIKKVAPMAETDPRQFNDSINDAFKLMLGGSVEEAITESINQLEAAEDEIIAVEKWLNKYQLNEEVIEAVAEFVNIIYDKS